MFVRFVSKQIFLQRRFEQHPNYHINMYKDTFVIFFSIQPKSHIPNKHLLYTQVFSNNNNSYRKYTQATSPETDSLKITSSIFDSTHVFSIFNHICDHKKLMYYPFVFFDILLKKKSCPHPPTTNIPSI